MVDKFDISKTYSIQEVGEMAKRSALSKPSPKGYQRKPVKKRLDPLNIGHKPFYESTEHSFQLYMGDCLEVLPKIPEGSIDMVFADPPYFLSNDGITCHAGRMVSVNKGKWDKSPGVGEMHEFNLRWLEACQRVLKKDGTIWVSGTNHVIHSIGFAMQQWVSRFSMILSGISATPRRTSVADTSPIQPSLSSGRPRIKRVAILSITR